MHIHIKYFASIRESLGRSGENWETNAATLGDLRLALVERDALESHPLGAGRAVRIALNQVMCEESEPIVEGAEVAFFPPVTGG